MGRSMMLAAAVAGAAALATSCGSQGDDIDVPDDVTPEDVAAADAVTELEQLITAAGVGPISPGMTFLQMQEALPDADFAARDDYLPGAIALCAREGGYDLVCGVALTTDVDENTPINLVATEHPRYRTQQGVAAGTRIADAEAVYGEAWLVFDPEVDVAEVVEFDNGPPSNVAFAARSPSAPSGLVGDYPPTDDGPDVETSDYRDDAVIARITVSAPRR